MANNTPSAKAFDSKIPYHEEKDFKPKSKLDRILELAGEKLEKGSKSAAIKILRAAGIMTSKDVQSYVDKMSLRLDKKVDPKTGKVSVKKKSGGKVYANQNKRYAHGGKVSGRKATYKY